MRIACPSCAAEYEVPASRIPPHKMVRCARCGGEWIAVREAAENLSEPEAAAQGKPPGKPRSERPPEPGPSLPVVTAMDRLAASTPPSPSHAGLIGAWVLTFVILAATAVATVAWREDIMRIWPPSSLILAPSGQIMAAPEQTKDKKAQ